MPPASPGRRRAVSGLSAWLLVLLVVALGGLSLLVPLLPAPDETLADLLRTPAVWPARVVASGPGVLPSWTALTLAGLAAAVPVFLLAAGATLVMGTTGSAGFAQGAFALLGGLAAVAVATDPALGDVLPGPTAELPLRAAAAAAALAAGGLAGAVLHGMLARAARGSGQRATLAALGTLVVAMEAGDIDARGIGPAAMAGIAPAATTGGAAAADPFAPITVAAGLGIYVLLALLLRGTRSGLVIRAAMGNPDLVAALGYRVGRLRAGVFVLAAALAGLGGMFWSLGPQGLTSPESGWPFVPVFAAVAIAGPGSVTGCFVGAVLIGLSQAYAAPWDPRLAQAAPLVVMALVLILRPAGLLARHAVPAP